MPLPPDVQYCFDAAIELGHLGGDTYDYFYNFKPDAARWFDDLDRESTPSPFTHHFERRALAEYLNTRHKLSAPERLYLSLSGASWAARWIRREGGLHMTNLILRDSFKIGGERLALKRVNNRKFILRRSRRILAPHLALMRGIAKRLHHDSKKSTFFEANDVRTEIAARNNRSWAELQLARKGIRRKKLREQKKVQRKALNIASQIVGEETARMYVRGDSVTLQGRRFGFRVKNTL